MKRYLLSLVLVLCTFGLLSSCAILQPVKTLDDPADLSPYLNKTKNTAVLFVLSYCPFCKAFEPHFEGFARTNTSRYTSLRIIVDNDNNPLWKKYRIEVTPTVIVLSPKGTLLKRFDGQFGRGLDPRFLKKL